MFNFTSCLMCVFFRLTQNWMSIMVCAVSCKSLNFRKVNVAAGIKSIENSLNDWKVWFKRDARELICKAESSLEFNFKAVKHFIWLKIIDCDSWRSFYYLPSLRSITNSFCLHLFFFFVLALTLHENHWTNYVQTRPFTVVALVCM